MPKFGHGGKSLAVISNAGSAQEPSAGNVFMGNLLAGNGSGGLTELQAPASQGIRNAVELSALTDDSGGFRQTIDGVAMDDVAANISTAVEIPRLNVPTGAATTAARFRAVRDGYVTGVVVTSTANATAGSLTVTVFKNSGLAGSSSGLTNLGLSATLDFSDMNRRQRARTTQPRGANSFFAGDELFVMVTSSSWAPTTAEIRCAIEIED